ncbi:copper chaperone PCu(A)C [Vibrio hepatarius]|jgi:copper(I)-binding protein|uniref:Copper chaperone PCu(A)C n=1 Tax=Vibrio hepatarius TaxID=171383 RepID=A0A0M0HZM7_9VIBR|nr:copper chaperone PCu(A)C [Vibrio hepatarius]KOO07529.1 hypothetical protein AKJ31_11615 [Vibrio hepatarius]
MKLKTLLLMGLVLSPFAQAATDVSVQHAYARATPPNAPTSAVFAEFENKGDAERVIVAASTSAAGKVELHDVIKEGDVMKMRQVEQIILPAQSTTVLKPGSLHIMLFQLAEPLVEGNQIDVKVTFANGDTQSFKAPIKKVMSGMKHNH